MKRLESEPITALEVALLFYEELMRRPRWFNRKFYDDLKRYPKALQKTEEEKEGTEKVSLQLFKELNLHIACILFGYVQIFCTLMP